MRCVPRFLWLGLIVCALALLVLDLVRAVEPDGNVDSGIAAARSEYSSPSAHLVAAHDVDQTDRAPIDATEPIDTAKVAAPGRTESTRAIHGWTDVSIEREPRFESGVIEVHVVSDHDGRPLAGVEVALARDETPEVQTTGSGGTVVFTNVVEGRASLSAILVGHARAAGEASISRGSPHASVELRLVVHLRDPRGLAFDPAAWQVDRPAARRIGIRLDSRCGGMGTAFDAVDVLRYGARSGEQGLGPFTWRVRIQRTSDVCVHALLDDVIIGVGLLDPAATELEVRLDPSAVEAVLAPVLIRVLEVGSEAPIAGAQIEFQGGAGHSGLRAGLDGRARVSTASAPSRELVVTARGYATAKLTLSRPYPPESVERLPVGRRIAGRVFDLNGAPLATASLDLYAVKVDDTAPPVMRSGSGSRGGFEFESVPAGEYRVQARYGSTRVEIAADCRDRDVLGLDVKLSVPKPAASESPR